MKNKIAYKLLTPILLFSFLYTISVFFLFDKIENQVETMIKEKFDKNFKNDFNGIKNRNLENFNQNIKESINSTSILLSRYMYSLEYDVVEELSYEFLISQEYIKGIRVFDELSKENMIIIYKKNNKIIKDNKLPNNISKYQVLSKDVKLKIDDKDENIGKVIFYIDDSIINERILFLKDKLKSNISNSVEYTKEKINSIIYETLCIINIISILFFIGIFFSIKNIILTPLDKLIISLNSLSNFLLDKSIEPIFAKVKTNDELENVSNLVNNSIQETQKLHNRVTKLTTNLEQQIVDRTFQLEERKNVFENIFSKSTLALAIIKDNVFIDCNKSMIKLFKCKSKNDILNKEPIIFSPLKQLDNYSANLQDKKIKECLDKGFCSFEWIHKDLNNNEFWTDITLTKIKINKEDIIYVVIKDIQEKKMLEIENNEKKSLIEDSINVGTYIQKSLLPNKETINSKFKDNFIIWQPKDKVSGDLYIYDECNKGILFGIVDCTGHGIPGAFLTMILHSAIKNIKTTIGFENISNVISNLNTTIKEQLGYQYESHHIDFGADIGLCFIDQVHNKLVYSGARIDLIYFENGIKNIIKADKTSIGYKRTDNNYKFTSHTIDINQNKRQTFYLYSDGIIDQIGGEKGFPFSKKKVLNIVSKIEHLEMKEQKDIILEEYNKYKNNRNNIDDVTMIGFKI
jgi:serine phosphatase RsbU (regulator of sigma subunit)